MYKTSDDRRFRKNKKEIRRAFIDLVMEKGYEKITISDIAHRADINRMTFYAHYDAIEDIFTEFIDDMEADIMEAISTEEEFSIDRLFNLLNGLMFEEIEFFRRVAKDPSLAAFRKGFKDTISQIIRVDLKQGAEEPLEKRLITSDLVAVCIAYSYLDWLAGDYGDVPLTDVVEITKDMLKTQLTRIEYRK